MFAKCYHKEFESANEINKKMWTHAFSLPSQLCYLHADLIKNLNAKETKKQFTEFHTTFLDKGAVSRTSLYFYTMYIMSMKMTFNGKLAMVNKNK